MLNDLITFFTGAPQNRRKYSRRAGPFPAWVAIGNQWANCTCLDISGSGLGMVSGTALPEEVNLRVQLDGKNVVIRAKRVWQQPGTAQGKPAWRYGLTFTGISADDWDAVVRFSGGGEAVEAENKAQKDLELVKLKADDVARLIPKKLQDMLLHMLVQKGRLAPVDEKNPLVQYSYGGVIKRQGKALHRLSIHSRVRDVTGEVKAYDTRFLFDDQGANVTMED